MLQHETVHFSRRICSVAATLCMIWPWMQQVAEQAVRKNGIASVWFTRVGGLFDTTKPGYVVPTVLAAALVAVFIKQSQNRRVEGAMANAGGSLLAIVYLG